VSERERERESERVRERERESEREREREREKREKEMSNNTFSGSYDHIDNYIVCILFSDCKNDVVGHDYAGVTSITKSGRKCQAWNSQKPHSHAQTNNIANFPDDNLSDAKNYCRNPGSSPGGPWCYTMDPMQRWEYCDIELCKGI
jgi:hypothetical protein